MADSSSMPSTGAQIGGLIGSGLIGAALGAGSGGPPQYTGPMTPDQGSQDIQNQATNDANTADQTQKIMNGAPEAGQALLGSKQDQGESSAKLGGNQDQGMMDALNQRAQRTYNSSIGRLKTQADMQGIQNKAAAQGQAFRWAAQKLKLYNDAKNAQEKADQDKKAAEGNVLGSILGVVGGIGGFLIGGPAGAAIGSQLGSGIGKGIG